MRMANKTAIVTGGGSGIGRATCVRFAEEGANLVVADIDESGAEETAAKVLELGRQALVAKADVSEKDYMAGELVLVTGGKSAQF